VSGPSYRGRRLDGTLEELQQALDLLDADTVPESYYLQVIAGRPQSGGEQAEVASAPADPPGKRRPQGGELW
jgi:hypothetical protein